MPLPPFTFSLFVMPFDLQTKMVTAMVTSQFLLSLLIFSLFVKMMGLSLMLMILNSNGSSSICSCENVFEHDLVSILLMVPAMSSCVQDKMKFLESSSK